MAVVASASRPIGSAARLTLPVVALTFGAVSASLPRVLSGRPTTYAAVSTGAHVADLVAGLGLLAAGGLACAVRRRGSVGPVTTLVGVAWLARDWIGWESGPSLARSVAMAAAPFVLPLVAHLAIAFPTGRVTGRAARVFVGVSYGAAAVASVGTAVARDPFLDQYCWANCTDNVFLVRADIDVMRFLDATWLWSSVATGLVLAVACGWRLALATRVARRSLWYVLVPAALAATAEVSYALLLMRDRAEDPERTAFATVFFVRAGPLAALALGVIWSVVRTYRTGRAVARLADDLGEAPPPGSLKAALARSLGDDLLDVAYWLPGPQHYVDSTGLTVEPRPGPEQTATAIVRESQTVALVTHDRGVRAERDLQLEIGAAARLAVDNERLRAEVLAQLENLRSSRARIVDTADATRRRLERDLHDGAQQRLLAVTYELRLASTAAAGDATLGVLLASASDEAQQALTELRELAQGIFPAILTEAGLGPAMQTLAERAIVPVEIVDVIDRRYPPATETAAYVVVTEAIGHAERRAATHVIVRIAEEKGRLIIEIHHDGASSPRDSLTFVADRVGALGGNLDADAKGLRAEIPCA